MKNFIKSNVLFSVIAAICAAVGVITEAGNDAYNWFPDKSGAGYYFAGVVAVLYFGAYIYQTYIAKPKV